MPKAVAEGVLQIGDVQLTCAVLDDANNTRVLTQNAFLKAIGRHPFAAGGTGSAIDETAPFLRAKNLKPFISEDLERSTKPILYLPQNPTSGAGGVGYGYPGSLLPDVCWVYQDALVAGALRSNQLHIGEACRSFLKAITNHAIEDLIDKATGFEDMRMRNTINGIIERHVTKAALPWVKMFHLDFYRHIYRLNGWEFDPTSNARPGVIGKWTFDIYERLAPGVANALRDRVKRNPKGKPTQKMTQLLTPEEGKPQLERLLEGVILLMRMSSNWKEFRMRLDEFYPRYDQSQLSLELDSASFYRLPEPPPTLEAP